VAFPFSPADAVAAAIEVREGSPVDTDLLLSWFDEAVRWLVARGQAGQWGDRPFSEQPGRVDQLRVLAASGGLRIAERHGHAAGALAVGDAPAYAPPAASSELYILLLLTSRRHAGQGIGAALVRHAVTEARAAKREMLRVDCWAGAPSLVRWYERQGFAKADTFELRGWSGQIFSMPLE
jgi:GNAT superfamily N-acetyltransferase